MDENKGALDTLIQERITGDTDFQQSIADLDDDAKASAIKEKRAEILENEAVNLLNAKKKAEEIAENQKIRAEKAERGNKKGDDTPKKSDSSLSPKDIYALMNAKVHEDDIEEVEKAARLLGKTIPDALKDMTVQAILKTKADYRRTAEATNIKTPRQGATKVSDTELMEKASRGEVPAKGSDEAERLFWARRGGKKA